MAKNLKNSIADIVIDALRKQDAATYHGRPTPEHLISSTVQQILDRIEREKLFPDTPKRIVEFQWNGVNVSNLSWPEDWPVPKIGEYVNLDSGESLIVAGVEYFPVPYGDSDPSIYVVLETRKLS